MALKSKLGPVYIPRGLDIWQFIQVGAARFLDRKALVEWPSGDSLTFREFLASVERVAAGLWQMGVRKGDVVLIFSPNTIKTPVMTNALLSIGATMTACNSTYTANEVYDHLRECDSKLIVTTNALLPVVKEVQTKLKGQLRVILYGERAHGYTTYQDLAECVGPSAPLVNINSEEDKSVLLFSSGTTGKPKGVVHTHSTILSFCYTISQSDAYFFDGEVEEAMVSFLPLFHIYGSALSMLMLHHGKTNVIMEYFDFENFLRLNSEYKCKIAFVVPPVATLMAKHPMVENLDFSALQVVFCAAASLGEELEATIIRKFKLSRVKQAYGLTECVSHMCNKETKQSSVGSLLPNCECKVIDLTTNKELGPGKEGELLVKGPQMMKGYLNRPEATAETIDKEGWLHTGDIGYYDQDQDFFITGRRKELIKYKGLQVAPASLEDLLLTHKAVQDAAVIGIPDQMAGELPMAFIVLKPNYTATEDEIKQYVADRVAPYKRLRGGVRFTTEIPKSPSGKILRRVLTENIKANKL